MRALTGGADPALELDALRGVHWSARHLTSGDVHGGHRSKRVGSSPEWLDYRAYRQGDDPSRIDWKLFGRTERVAIRLSPDESTIRTRIIADASASMAFPAASLDKWERAAAVALGLVAVAHADGDPVGLSIVSGHDLRGLPVTARRDVVISATRLLAATSPHGSAPLAPVLDSIGLSRRIAIISDFLGDLDPLFDRCRELVAAGSQVHIVHIVATEELDPAPMGVVADPENPDVLRPLEEGDLAAYRAAFASWLRALEESWRRAGAAYTRADTGERADRIVRRVVAADHA